MVHRQRIGSSFLFPLERTSLLLGSKTQFQANLFRPLPSECRRPGLQLKSLAGQTPEPRMRPGQIHRYLFWPLRRHAFCRRASVPGGKPPGPDALIDGKRKHLRQVRLHKAVWLIHNVVKQSVRALVGKAAVDDLPGESGEILAVPMASLGRLRITRARPAAAQPLPPPQKFVSLNCSFPSSQMCASNCFCGFHSRLETPRSA